MGSPIAEPNPTTISSPKGDNWPIPFPPSHFTITKTKVAIIAVLITTDKIEDGSVAMALCIKSYGKGLDSTAYPPLLLLLLLLVPEFCDSDTAWDDILFNVNCSEMPLLFGTLLLLFSSG